MQVIYGYNFKLNTLWLNTKLEGKRRWLQPPVYSGIYSLRNKQQTAHQIG